MLDRLTLDALGFFGFLGPLTRFLLLAQSPWKMDAFWAGGTSALTFTSWHRSLLCWFSGLLIWFDAHMAYNAPGRWWRCSMATWGLCWMRFGFFGFLMCSHEPSVSDLRRPADSDQWWPSPPVYIWRCLKCSSRYFEWRDDHWRCLTCHSAEHYQINRSTKQVTPEGTWLYVPHGQPVPSPRSRRRRRRNAGPPSQKWWTRGRRNGWVRDSNKWSNCGTWSPPGPSRSTASRTPSSFTPTFYRRPHPRLRIRSWLPWRSSPIRRTMNRVSGIQERAPTEDWDGSQPNWNWRYGATEFRAYAKCTKKVTISELQMKSYASKPDQAPLLYNSLTGWNRTRVGVSHDCGSLQWPRNWDHPGEIESTHGAEGSVPETQVLARLREHIGEHMRAFINRFRRSQRNLRPVGIDVTSTYAQLLDRSGLTLEAQRLILVGTQQNLSFEAVAEAMVLQFPVSRIAGGEESGGKGKGGKLSPSSSSSASTSASCSSYSNKSFSSMPKRAFVAETEGAEAADAAEPSLDTIEEDEGIQDEPNEEDNDDPDQEDDPSVFSGLRGTHSIFATPFPWKSWILPGTGTPPMSAWRLPLVACEVQRNVSEGSAAPAGPPLAKLDLLQQRRSRIYSHIFFDLRANL